MFNSYLGLCLPPRLCVSRTFRCIPGCLTMVVFCILLLTGGICLVGAHCGSLLLFLCAFKLFLLVML